MPEFGDRSPPASPVLLLLPVLLAACVSRQSGPAASEAPATVPLSDLAGLTLQVGDQKGGTESLLRAAGQLDDLPYQVQFSTFTSGPPQIEAATAGKIDFAITGNTPPIFGAAAGAKVKVVSAYDGGGVGDQILVHCRLADHLDRRSARQVHCGRQGQLGPRPHPGPAARRPG